MALRAPHGNAKEHGIPGSRVETLPPDELPTPNAEEKARGMAITKARGRPFTRNNKAAVGRRPALVSLGVRVEDAKDPAYLLELRRGARYRKRRVAELCRLTGGELSAGAALHVRHEAMAAVGVSYLFAQAAKDGLSVDERAELLLKMDRLAQGAKQHGIAAFEIAVRECRARVDPDLGAQDASAGLVKAIG